MKSIEVWAPVFAEPVADINASILGGNKSSQSDSVRIEGLEPIDLGNLEVGSDASAGFFDGDVFKKTFSIMRPHKVNMGDVTNNLKETLNSFQELLNDLPKPTSGYFIDEIELNFGINGSGGIVLIGKMDMGMEAGIKVKIKRKPQ